MADEKVVAAAAVPPAPALDIEALINAAVAKAVAAMQPKERVSGPRKVELTAEEVEALKPKDPGEGYRRATAVVEAHGLVHVVSSLLADDERVLAAFEQDAKLAKQRAELDYSQRVKVEGHPKSER